MFRRLFVRVFRLFVFLCFLSNNNIKTKTIIIRLSWKSFWYFSYPFSKSKIYSMNILRITNILLCLEIRLNQPQGSHSTNWLKAARSNDLHRSKINNFNRLRMAIHTIVSELICFLECFCCRRCDTAQKKRQEIC